MELCSLSEVILANAIRTSSILLFKGKIFIFYSISISAIRYTYRKEHPKGTWLVCIGLPPPFNSH